jgi:hypothetical protein
MNDKSVMYVEAFVENGYGYRYRFFDRDDVSAIVIEYQRWDDKAKVWKSEPSSEVIFGFDEIEAVYKAMCAVKTNSPI